jgi:phosphate:Na+ symporter
VTPLWLTLLGGFGLLLFGLKTASEAAQALAGDRLRRMIGEVRRDRLHGFAAGLLVSAVSQSSSVTTVMVVSFVNAGLMTLWQAASVALGANVGATITGWLLALRLANLALLLVGAGALAAIFSRRERVRLSAELALGFGLLFVGLGWLESGFAPLRSDPVATGYLSLLGADGFGRLLFTVLVGCVATVLVQSNAAMLGVTMAMGTVGLITFDIAAALVLGENVGATMAAQRAASGATTDSRRAALFHTLVNALGVIVILFLFQPWIAMLDALLPGTPDLLDASGGRPAMAVHIALAHTSFNVLMAAIALPALGPLLGIVTSVVGPSSRDRPELRFLRQSMVESPALAIEQGRLEVLHMADIAAEALRLTRQLIEDARRPHDDVRDSILKRERATDDKQHAITVFMSRVMARPLTMAQSEEIRSLIRVADEIESIADYCERIANYRRRMLREDIALSDAALHELHEYFDRTVGLYDEILDRVRRSETGWFPAIETKADYLATEADGLRDANLHRLATQRADPGEGIFFNDLLVAMRRIRNHALNMAEALETQLWPALAHRRDTACRVPTTDCVSLAFRALAGRVGGTLLAGGDIELVVEVHRLDRGAVGEHAHRHFAVGGFRVGDDAELIGRSQQRVLDRDIGLLGVALPVDELHVLAARLADGDLDRRGIGRAATDAHDPPVLRQCRCGRQRHYCYCDCGHSTRRHRLPPLFRK